MCELCLYSSIFDTVFYFSHFSTFFKLFFFTFQAKLEDKTNTTVFGSGPNNNLPSSSQPLNIANPMFSSTGQNAQAGASSGGSASTNSNASLLATGSAGNGSNLLSTAGNNNNLLMQQLQQSMNNASNGLLNSPSVSIKKCLTNYFFECIVY